MYSILDSQLDVLITGDSIGIFFKVLYIFEKKVTKTIVYISNNDVSVVII